MLKHSTLAGITVAIATVLALFLFANSLWIPVSLQEQDACLKSARETGNKQPDCHAYETVLGRGLRDPVAYYTLWLMLFTGALAVFGVFQIRLLVRADKLAKESLDQARISSERQLRAYVLIDSSELVRDGPGIVLQLKVRNFGETPAYATQITLHSG
jgi:hypothetical protein